jgi:nitric oxide reductase large subunit
MKDLRGLSVSAVKNAIMKEFNLPSVGNKRKNLKAVLEWKKSKQVGDCYNKLYDDEAAVVNITKRAFPFISPDDEETFPNVYVYTAAVADIVLNPNYPDVECARKPLERRYQKFKVILAEFILLLLRIKFIKIYRINILGIN